jgi:glyoxylase-like metal-dependent hydrolase (beta-lactamase superfamily II)
LEGPVTPRRTFSGLAFAALIASAASIAVAQQPSDVAATDGLCATTVSLPPAQGGARAGGGGGRGAGPAQPTATELPRLVKVKDDVYVIQNVNNTVNEIGQLGGNITVYLTDEGVILIDSKNEQMHDDVVAKVRSLTEKPIKYVILTHNHQDHSGGAAKMQQMGATVIISRDDWQQMARAGQTLSHVAYSRSASVVSGDKEVQLTEYCGHTRGDTVAYLPAARIVVAGDLVTTPDTIPQIVNYGDGGNWTDMGKTLDALASTDFDLMVAGHGPVLTKQQFLEHRAKVDRIRDRARTLVKAGRNQEEITQTLLKEFNWGSGPAAGNIAGMIAEFR